MRNRFQSRGNASAAERKLQDAFDRARALHRHHGKSYYFATQLFPRDLRDATHALYAFFRVPDEIVDNSPQDTPEQRVEVEGRLNAWLDEWRRAYEVGESDDPVLHVTAHSFHKHNIPFALSEDFLRAMIQDVHQARYESYAELENYMWGSAAVVGVMMSYVIGFEEQRTLDYAPKLGYAMQLTNFLRDIEEDWDLRGRVYMPQDELKEFGLSNDDIAHHRFSPQFREFMQWQAARAHRLYDEANTGIGLLNPRGRAAVRVASALYRAILDKLEVQDWNPFVGRARTNLGEKVLLAGRALRQK